MMNSRFRIAGAVLLLGMAIGAQAQVTKVGSKYQFRLKYTVGKTLNYNMRTSTAIMGKNMDVDMPMKVKCTGQKGDVYTVVATSGPPVSQGKPMAGQKPQTATYQIKSTGEPVGAGAQGASLSNIKMPKEAIPVGHVWDGTIGLPQGGGSAKASYKFLGLKTINGKQCAQIAVSMTMNGMANMKGNGTISLLMADGQAQVMQMTVGGTFAGGGQGSKPMELKSSISMKRV